MDRRNNKDDDYKVTKYLYEHFNARCINHLDINTSETSECYYEHLSEDYRYPNIFINCRCPRSMNIEYTRNIEFATDILSRRGTCINDYGELYHSDNLDIHLNTAPSVCDGECSLLDSTSCGLPRIDILDS